MPDLNINIGARIASSLRGTLQEARQEFSQFTSGVDSAIQQLTGLSTGEIVLDHFKEKLTEIVLGPVASFVVGIGAINVALRLMDAATEQAAVGLERFRKVEDIQATFQPLLGGAVQARARLAELAQFAADTPFELPEVAAASKTLEVLTRGALSTGDGLRLVGDVAASTGAPFQEIAMWVGRLYDNLQSGRPIGEAMMRLQELGTVSGVTRARIEEMQKAGAAGNDVWRVAKTELDRTSGSMAILSQTITGLRSTMEDARSALYRAFAASMVDKEKESAQGATKAFEAMTPVAEHLGDVLADLSVTDAPTDWVGFLDAPLKAVIAKAMQAKDVLNVLISVTAAVTTGFVAFAAAAGAAAFVGFISKGSGMITIIAQGVIQTAKWPVEIYRLITAQIAQAAATGAVTTQMRAQIIATVLAKEAVKAYTAVLGAARAALVAFATSPLAWITVAAAGLYLWYQSMERALKKLQELTAENAMYADKAANATAGIVTTTDRLNKLAEAYADVKKARDALAKAPPGSVEEELAKQNLANAMTRQKLLERMNVRDLKPGDATKASQDAVDKTNMETYLKGQTPAVKLDIAEKQYQEMRGVQSGLDAASGKAKHAASPEGLQDLSRKENALRTAYDAAEAADKAEEERLKEALRGTGGEPLLDSMKVAAEDRLEEIQGRREWRNKVETDEVRSKSGRPMTDMEKINAVTAQRESAPGAAEAAALAAQKHREEMAKKLQEMPELKRAKFDYDVQRAELRAQEEIAALQGEGIDRAYREYVIQQDLTKQKWELAKAAGYQREQELANLETIERKAKMGREWEKDAKASEARSRDIQSGRYERKDARQVRAIDRAEARGEITGKEADEQRAQLAERQKWRVERERDRLRDEVRELAAKGDNAGADRARKESISKDREADALGFQVEDLRNPLPQRQSAVADSMRRVGGGGNAFYGGGGKNPLETKMDRQIKASEEAVAALKRIEEKRSGLTVQ